MAPASGETTACNLRPGEGHSPSLGGGCDRGAGISWLALPDSPLQVAGYHKNLERNHMATRKVTKSEENVLDIPLTKIEFAPWNPNVRTRPRAYEDLKEDIADKGQLVPAQVVEHPQKPGMYLLVDGHRRFCALRDLGQESMMCRLSDEDPAELYVGVNANYRRHRPKEWLEVYLLGGKPDKRTGALIMELEQLCGREYLEELAKRGQSPTVLSTANRICHYIQDFRPEKRRRVLQWLINHKMQVIVDRAMRATIAPTDLDEVIEANQALRLVIAAPRGQSARALW